jgi:hypothetical protein
MQASQLFLEVLSFTKLVVSISLLLEFGRDCEDVAHFAVDGA